MVDSCTYSYPDFPFDLLIVGGDCWFWAGGHNGHGRPYWKNKLVYRIVYEILVGPIPRKLVLDHECDNKRCVRPLHLVPKTQRKNLLRSGVQFNLGSHLGKGDVSRLGEWATVGNTISVQNLGAYAQKGG